MMTSEDTATDTVLEAPVQRRVTPDQPVSEAVVLAVAEATDRDVLAGPEDGLAPLYGAVDPDALDALFADQAPEGAMTVEFSYEGYRVAVEADGVVTVTAE